MKKSRRTDSRRSERGGAFLEYLIVIAFVVLGLVAAAKALGSKMSDAYKSAETKVGEVQQEIDSVKIR